MAEDEKTQLKICLVSDFDMRFSGYFNISASVSEELTMRGHEVKCVGLGYNGEEHTFPFGLIPAKDLRESFAVLTNLRAMWGFDVLIVALDIPVQEQFINYIAQNAMNDIKYVGIMPIEADPLCLSWALLLMQMHKVFIISQFGTYEAKKVGVEAEYLPVGVDLDSWRSPTGEERLALRKALGFKEDEFVVLTVGYNQERKFLSRSMEIFAEFAKGVPEAKYVMVTAEQSQVGWKLRDLAQELGIQDKFIILERGMPHKNLWGVYAASDVFLLTSKAEGLGLILMEAMSVGLPCIGTDCTGIHELLDNGRGFLIGVDYEIRDPYGNGRRYYAEIEDGVGLLNLVYEFKDDVLVQDKILDAKEYIEQRTWDKTVDVLEKGLLEVVNVKKE